MVGGIPMRHGKITHNLYVNEREYLNLKKQYPTGNYTVSETLNWFTVTIENQDVLTVDNNFCIEIIFWRTE